MTRRRAPLFLARRGYRRRRLRDGARMLPLFGAFLFLLPILWEPAASERRDTAPDGIYLFVVWALLILVAAAIAPRLRDEAREDEAEDETV
ncbi:hypothetical protein SAMN05878503_11552 [Cereibacter ovatus]|uniref:Uncharacterized protein n=1 Tax=Cereibacter ovatus TaxID=439529 RepID=A0A285D2G0_9RHOB|nr:hypothetical protein [Cereibacter ovatus]SNX73373.1 hypothetical protein SAMN05878503_11552 [Cereibacter ovatus]